MHLRLSGLLTKNQLQVAILSMDFFGTLKDIRPELHSLTDLFPSKISIPAGWGGTRFVEDGVLGYQGLLSASPDQT